MNKAQTLRPYQVDGLRRVLDAYKQGARRVLMILPTGGGKTSCFSSLASELARHGKRTLVLVHRRELAEQAANRFREFGTSYGLIVAGQPSRPQAPVQIATVQTLVRRRAPPAEFVVCDEAHLSTAATWQTLLDQYPHANVLGCSGSPWRMGGKPLIGAYDASVVVTTPAELTRDGFLCGYNGFSYLAPDLAKISTVGGEYNEQQSSAAMREPTIVANIVEQWSKHASHLSTVVFAVTIEHSKDLIEQFKAAGVRSEHIDGSTPLEQRRAILRRVDSGETRVLSNVGVLVEGIDIPRLKCCILARPTKSLARFIQMTGRVRRPFEGRPARIHDHAFNIKLHGLPDADRDYSLHARNEDPPALTTCEICLALYTGNVCPSCAHANAPRETGERELVTCADAEQFEFSSEAPAPEVIQPPVDVRWSEVGKVVEGVFDRSWEESTQWGTTRRYVVKGAKRSYNFPGTTRLNTLMRVVKQGDQIRVTYTGARELGGGKQMKEFTVEIDR